MSHYVNDEVIQPSSGFEAVRRKTGWYSPGGDGRHMLCKATLEWCTYSVVCYAFWVDSFGDMSARDASSVRSRRWTGLLHDNMSGKHNVAACTTHDRKCGVHGNSPKEKGSPEDRNAGRVRTSNEAHKSADQHSPDNTSSPSDENRQVEDNPGQTNKETLTFTSSLQKHLPPKHSISFVKMKATHQYSRQRRLRNFIICTVLLMLVITICAALVVTFTISWHRTRLGPTTPTFKPSEAFHSKHKSLKRKLDRNIDNLWDYLSWLFYWDIFL